MDYSSTCSLFFVHIVFCIMKVVFASSHNECYKSNQSWTNTETIEVFYPVSEPEECQILCQVWKLFKFKWLVKIFKSKLKTQGYK